MTEDTTEKQTLDESFIGFLEGILKRDDRAVLAHLRKGLGKPPGSTIEMFPYVARFVQRNYRGDENAYFLVASLFALYPTYSWKAEDTGNRNVGRSLALMKEKSESIERRFVALLNSDEEDLPNHLRQIISLLKSEDKPINWLQLLKDIKSWSHETKYVQRNWAKGFWGYSPSENNKGDETK